MMWIDAQKGQPKVKTDVLVTLVTSNPRNGLNERMRAIGWREPDGSWTVLLPGVVLPDAPVTHWQGLPEFPDDPVV